MKRFKNEKGLITIVTLITVIFMISFLISSYIIVANKVKTQKEMLNETKNIYQPKNSMEEIYNSYFSNDETIAIHTVEQLLAMGNNEKVNIDGKIYTFSDSVGYILMNNLEFDVDEWQHILGTNTDWTPIEETEIVFDWNGHEIVVTKLDNTTVIYKENILPYEYQQVEYIESTGTQYIDTLIKADQNTKVETKIEITNFSKSFNILGSRTSATENNFEAFYDTVNIVLDFENYTNNRLIVPYSIDNNILKISNIKLVVGKESKEVAIYNNFETPDNIYIFDVSGNKNDFERASAKLYYFRMWNNNLLVRDFIPCYRKLDNKSGLYDLANNVFYTNLGTGEFTVGADA